MNRQKPPTWSQIKSGLSCLEKEDVISILRDLYQLNADNKVFLVSRLGLADLQPLIEPYKRAIRSEFNPDRGLPRLNLRAARKVLTDFKKTGASPRAVADLMVYYVEQGIACTLEYGDISASFYSSLESVFREAIAFICKMNDRDVIEEFRPRLERIVVETRSVGWGFRSDCFAAMSFSQYALASGDDKAKKIALGTYRNILQRKDNPKGKYSKVVPGARLLKSLALPMILSNLSLEMEWLLDSEDLNRTIDQCVAEVFGLFLDKERHLLFEHVSPDGSHPDCFDGRLINPGHGIEAMWFFMDIARRRGDRDLVNKAIDVALSILEFGWDKEYGGIFYFLDTQGKPPQQLEWDQKLWWVHAESLVAMMMGYALSGREECWEWYERVHEYTWKYFPDPEYGEWFGYLNRRGEVLLNLKGGKWI